MDVKYRLLLFVAIATAGCSPVRPQAEEACGESFCIQGIAAGELSKRSPVEDFNLYRVASRSDFVIYEGNAPQEGGQTFDRVVIGDTTWAISRDGEAIEARLFRPNLQWPQYLVVTRPCQPIQRCEIDAFLATIRPIPPKS